MLTVVVFLWVASSFLINNLFENDLYRKPFFITYLSNATFVFYLTPYIHKAVLYYSETGCLDYKEVEAEVLNGSSDEEISLNEDNGEFDKLSLRETIKLSAQFNAIWYLANLATNASLSYTSVGSQTILSATSSFFTLLIGGLARTETFTCTKISAMIVSFIGIVLLTQQDSNNASSEVQRSSVSILIGNLFALAGALLYGIYSTLLKLKIGDESRINMKIFFGFVGLFNLVFLWPLILVFHFTGLETFELPSGMFVLSMIFLNCLIAFVSDFCWVKAMLLTSPLIVTVGLSTTIPLAMAGDIIFKQEKITVVYVLAAGLVGASFFVVNNDAQNDKHID